MTFGRSRPNQILIDESCRAIFRSASLFHGAAARRAALPGPPSTKCSSAVAGFRGRKRLPQPVAESSGRLRTITQVEEIVRRARIFFFGSLGQIVNCRPGLRRAAAPDSNHAEIVVDGSAPRQSGNGGRALGLKKSAQCLERVVAAPSYPLSRSRHRSAPVEQTARSSKEWPISERSNVVPLIRVNMIVTVGLISNAAKSWSADCRNVAPSESLVATRPLM